MKHKSVIIVLAILALAGLVLAQGAPGGGRGGGRRGMGGMGAMMYIESTWTALCFEIGLSNVQIGKLKPSFQWAWKARKQAMTQARQTRDFQAAGATLAQIKTTLDQHVPIVLTAEQKKAWKQWQQQMDAMRSSMRPPGGGKGGAQGGAHK